MDTRLLIKTFFARLAGVPLATGQPPPQIVHRSRLYVVDVAPPLAK